MISAVPSLARAATALNSDTVCISVLHTTDLHGHILPTTDYNGNVDLGGLVRQLQSEGEERAVRIFPIAYGEDGSASTSRKRAARRR